MQIYFDFAHDSETPECRHCTFVALKHSQRRKSVFDGNVPLISPAICTKEEAIEEIDIMIADLERLKKTIPNWFARLERSGRKKV